MYNVGTEKFISYNESNKNQIPLSAAPTTSAIEFKTSELSTHPIIIGVEKHAINQNTTNNNYQYGAIFWENGWTGWANDPGSCNKTTEIGNAADETLKKIEGLVFIHEMKNDYFRLKGHSGNYIDASSIYNNATAKVGQMSMNSNDACNLAGTIFYFDENKKFLNYATGTYIRETREIGSIANNDGNSWTISMSGTEGKYKLYSNANAWLHDYSGNRTDRCSEEENHANTNHSWTIEKVTSLPVTITAAGYATLYAPVALYVPSGVEAYTVTINGKRATLNKIESRIIPANTGVVLKGNQGSYSFEITEYAPSLETNYLLGSVPATFIADDAYVLAVKDDVVGFYKAAKNQQNNSAFINNSHKAYLPASAVPASANNISFFGFRFGDDEEETTGVEEVEIRNEKEEIFDLAGRRISEITSPGIYIVNGKKVLVK